MPAPSSTLESMWGQVGVLGRADLQSTKGSRRFSRVAKPTRNAARPLARVSGLLRRQPAKVGTISSPLAPNRFMRACGVTTGGSQLKKAWEIRREHPMLRNIKAMLASGNLNDIRSSGTKPLLNPQIQVCHGGRGLLKHDATSSSRDPG